MEWGGFVEELRRHFPDPSQLTAENVCSPDAFPLDEALYTATEHDCLGALELIVNYFNVNLHTTSCRGHRSILHLACTLGALGVTCFCLDRGVPVELRDHEGRTPLMRAVLSVEERGLECTQVLLEARADPNALDYTGWTVLHCAVFYGAVLHGSESSHSRKVELLLQHGASVNALDRYDHTPLHLAMLSARANGANLVGVLLQHGASVNAQSRNGCTPLLLSRDEGVALRLLEAGADPNVRKRLDDNRLGESILHFACQKWKASAESDFETLINFLYNPDNVNSPDAEGRTPLHWVCQQSTEYSLRYVQPMILKGANPDAQDLAGRTPLHYASLIPAIAFGKTTLLNSERRIPDEIEPVEIDMKRTVTLVERLVALGADISSQDGDGQSALHYASLTGSIEIVRCLLEHGSPVGQRDHLGRTPLHLFGFRIGPVDMSAWSGADTSTFLNEHGHDEELLVRTRNREYEGSTHPHCVIKGDLFDASRRQEVVETLGMLLHAGAPLNATDNAGNFPFFLLTAARWLDPVFLTIREAAAQGLFERNGSTR